MILSYYEIHELLANGVVLNADPANVNGSSLDITLAPIVLREIPNPMQAQISNLRDKVPLKMQSITIPEKGFIFPPGGFILASSVEVFNLPLNISAQYYLKSSMARIGLDHCLAGWCDAGWHDSALTMELQNVSRYHTVRLFKGDLIGQMVFHKHEFVPADRSYAARGRYNNDAIAKGIKA
jgi:dCTP deaminase